MNTLPQCAQHAYNVFEKRKRVKCKRSCDHEATVFCAAALVDGSGIVTSDMVIVTTDYMTDDTLSTFSAYSSGMDALDEVCLHLCFHFLFHHSSSSPGFLFSTSLREVPQCPCPF